MKKLLNTLYVTRQESYLHKERETIVIKQQHEKLAQFPALAVANILCFGQVSVSPPLMGFCGEQGIGLAFYSEFGKFLARVYGRQTGNVLLRRTQYRWADDPTKSVAIARLMVGAKIANACLDHGVRVQNSVFECEVEPAKFAVLKNTLLNIYEPKHDSLRFYFLGKRGRQRVEHFGAKPTPDPVRDPLIV